jgi:YggT family protein
MTSALIYIIEAFSHLFLMILLLRFWLPWFGADFRNPIAQGILRLTSPLINPVRRFVPSLGRVDTATVVIAFAIQCLTIMTVLKLRGFVLSIGMIALISLFELASLTLLLFMFAIIVRIILSWIAPQTYNPATALLATITDPLLRPFRRIIPPLGGFDISPIFAIILLGALNVLLDDLQRSIY